MHEMIGRPAAVRLGTWNCHGHVATKWDALSSLPFDVLALQECEEETRETAEAHGWSAAWSPGRYEGWGIAVLARGDFAIESWERPEPFYISAIVTGPIQFRFICFWAMAQDPFVGGLDYWQQAARLIEQLPDDDLPTVIAGDFNTQNIDRHLTNVEALRSRSFFSAFHEFHGVEIGTAVYDRERLQATRYHPPEQKPFHIDFVFMSQQWSVEDVLVGRFDDYVPARLSDHMPVIATVSPKTALMKG